MKRAIWKWGVSPRALNEIPMPRGAEILTVQLQRGAPCIWALVDPDAPKEIRKLWAIPTGISQQMDPSARYIGTFQLYEGDIVLHLFEESPNGSN